MKLFDIDMGLWLEERGVRLTWDSLPDVLQQNTKPDVCTVSAEVPPVKTLAWNDRVWGGLKCQVTTVFGRKRYPQATLHGLRLVVWRPDGIRSCADGFRWLQSKLVERCGSPDSFRDDGEQGEAVWHLGGVVVRHEYLDEMGGGHYVFVFRREGVAEQVAPPDAAAYTRVINSTSHLPPRR